MKYLQDSLKVLLYCKNFRYTSLYRGEQGRFDVSCYDLYDMEKLNGFVVGECELVCIESVHYDKYDTDYGFDGITLQTETIEDLEEFGEKENVDVAFQDSQERIGDYLLYLRNIRPCISRVTDYLTKNKKTLNRVFPTQEVYDCGGEKYLMVSLDPEELALLLNNENNLKLVVTENLPKDISNNIGKYIILGD